MACFLCCRHAGRGRKLSCRNAGRCRLSQTGSQALLPECQTLPAQSDGFASSLAGMPGNWLLCQAVAGMQDYCRLSHLCCRNAGRCRLSQTVERCKIFESKVLPYCFEKIFDRGRSTLMLILQIRNLGSCFVEFLQSSFRCFLIDDAFFLTIMFQVVLLTEYHASNRTERLY